MSQKSADLTFKIDENCWKYVKEIPSIHRNTFVHLAIMEATKTELYRKLCGKDDAQSSPGSVDCENTDEINFGNNNNSQSPSQQQKATTWDDF